MPTFFQPDALTVILHTYINPLCPLRIHRNHDGAACIRIFWDFSQLVALIQVEARLLRFCSYLQLCKLCPAICAGKTMSRETEN